VGLVPFNAAAIHETSASVLIAHDAPFLEVTVERVS